MRQPNLIDTVLAQPAEGEWKMTATFKERKKVIDYLDRAALVAIEAIHKECPNITTGEMFLVLANAMWWLEEVASDAAIRKVEGGDAT